MPRYIDIPYSDGSVGCGRCSGDGKVPASPPGQPDRACARCHGTGITAWEPWALRPQQPARQGGARFYWFGERGRTGPMFPVCALAFTVLMAAAIIVLMVTNTR